MVEEETTNLEDLRGEAKPVYKLIKADRLTLEELERAHEIGFDGAEFDDTNDLHLQMAGAVAASRERIEVAARAEREAEQEKGRQIAAEILQRKWGVDPATVPPEMLNSIYVSLQTQAAEAASSEFPDVGQHIEHLLVQDDDELLLVGPNDEIIAFVNAPHADLDRRNILEWVGERMTTAQAKQVGKQAEKDFWTSKINKIYDPQINRQARIVARLENLYEPVGQAYLDELRLAVSESNYRAVKESPQAKVKPLPKSVKIGLLTLQYRADSARVDIADDAKAQAFLGQLIETPEVLREYLSAVLTDPEEIERNMATILANTEVLSGLIKVEKKVMKSQIPSAIKLVLIESRKSETGLYWYPGGVPQFSMK